MVTIHFKLSDLGTVQFEIDKPGHLDKLLKQCAAGKDGNPGSYIAIRRGKVISGQTLIADADEITVFPALSGG